MRITIDVGLCIWTCVETCGYTHCPIYILPSVLPVAVSWLYSYGLYSYVMFDSDRRSTVLLAASSALCVMQDAQEAQEVLMGSPQGRQKALNMQKLSIRELLRYLRQRGVRAVHRLLRAATRRSVGRQMTGSALAGRPLV